MWIRFTWCSQGYSEKKFFSWTRVLKCQRFITWNNRDAWVLRIPVFHCESISPGAYTRVLGKEVFRLNASFEMPKVQTMEMLGCLEYPYFGVNPFQLVFTRVLWKEVFKLNVSFEMPKVKIDASGKRRIRSTNSHLFGWSVGSHLCEVSGYYANSLCIVASMGSSKLQFLSISWWSSKTTCGWLGKRASCYCSHVSTWIQVRQKDYTQHLSRMEHTLWFR